MSNHSKEPLAFVTGVDDKCVFVWSSEYPLEELRFPVKLGAQKPQLGQKVQYVCTKSSHEVQFGGILKKVDASSPVIVQRDGDFVIAAHIGFPSPGSNYCLRELAMAEDYHIRFYCHSVELGTVVSFRDWEYDWQKVYQVHLKRFPKNCDWMIPRVSTMWHICNMHEVTDSAKAAQISSLMPWNIFYGDCDAGLIPMQSMADLDVTHSDFGKVEMDPFYCQSTSQMGTKSSSPLVDIEDCNRQPNAIICNSSGERQLPHASQCVTSAVNIQSDAKQQSYQIVELIDNNAASSRRELTHRFNDFADLVSDLKPNVVAPNFGVMRQSQTGPKQQTSELQSRLSSCDNVSQVNSTISQFSNNKPHSAGFTGFGMYVAKMLSKTPQNRIGDAVRLKSLIFTMCANKQTDLMG